MKIHIGQINCQTGDLDGNTSEIVSEIKKAQKNSCDVVVFPETSVSGYCCGALYDRPDFIRKQMDLVYEEILPLTNSGIIVILGVVWMDFIKSDGFPYLTNSALVIQNGKIVNRYNKTTAANHDHHEDNKYFNFTSNQNGVCEVEIGQEKVKIGTLICEDIWDKNYYDRHYENVKDIKKEGAKILFVLNQSYFHCGKYDSRINHVCSLSEQYKIPIVYTNVVGVGDIVKNFIIYDGGSFVVRHGKLIGRALRFTRDSIQCDITTEDESSEIEINEQIIRLPEYKYSEILDCLIFATKEIFKIINIPNAQVHLSGGIDSAVVAYIAKKAMGKDNVIFITNPSNQNKLGKYINKISKNLGVICYIQNIEGSYKDIQNSIYFSVAEQTKEKNRDENLNKMGTDKLIDSTIQAVVRTVFGLASSHLFNSGIIATGNHTEIVEGWANFHDIGSVGVMSLIGDLTKVEVFRLAEYINTREKKEIIPKELFDGTVLPAAELVDTDLDPFDYFVRSGIDAEMIRNRKTINALVEEFKNMKLNPELFPPDWNDVSIYDKVTVNQFKEQCISAEKNSRNSVFKAAQAAPIVIISPRSRGFSNRETIINRYKEQI